VTIHDPGTTDASCAIVLVCPIQTTLRCSEHHAHRSPLFDLSRDCSHIGGMCHSGAVAVYQPGVVVPAWGSGTRPTLAHSVQPYQAELDNGAGVDALRRFNDNLRKVPADRWGTCLAAVAAMAWLMLSCCSRIAASAVAQRGQHKHRGGSPEGSAQAKRGQSRGVRTSTEGAVPRGQHKHRGGSLVGSAQAQREQSQGFSTSTKGAVPRVQHKHRRGSPEGSERH
jgi:hypothetical protein